MVRKEGYFIAIEGLDCAGKGTVVEYLKQNLANEKVAFTFELGGGGAERIREFFLDKNTRNYDWKTQLLLACAGRNENITKVIIPNREKGITVISDRYEASTFAFQMPDLDYVNISYYQSISENVVYGVLPSLYIYLDIKPEETVKRMASAGKELDSFEGVDLAALKKRYDAYKFFFKNIRRMKDTVVVDATLSKEDVCSKVLRIVKQHLKGKRFNNNFNPRVSYDVLFGDRLPGEDFIIQSSMKNNPPNCE